jgi:hypothetical protein
MPRPLPKRFWFETILGVVSAAALALTLATPDWYEHLFDFAPDGGDGSAEWGLATALAVATLVLFVDAGRIGLRHSRRLAEARSDRRSSRTG